MQQALTFSQVLTIGLLSGLTAAVVNQAIVWLKEVHARRSELHLDAAFAAQRIAVLLETYAVKCAEAISDNDFYRQSEGYAGKTHTTMPSLPEYAIEENWKALDPGLRQRVLALRYEIDLAESWIDFWHDVDRGTTTTSFDMMAGKCGYRAWILAEDLQIKYGQPLQDISEFEWDRKPSLKKYHDKAIADLKQRQGLT